MKVLALKPPDLEPGLRSDTQKGLGCPAAELVLGNSNPVLSGAGLAGAPGQGLLSSFLSQPTPFSPPVQTPIPQKAHSGAAQRRVHAQVQ